MADGTLPDTPGDAAREALVRQFRHVRGVTEALAEPLSPEDQCLQSMPSCSPTKWHRAHTTWFFETFVLGPHGLAPHDPRFGKLFNSYYEALGDRHPRDRRGLLSRPSAGEVGEYRRVVDARVEALLASLDDRAFAAVHGTMQLGLAHEEQHQELLLTDILNALDASSLRPPYRARDTANESCKEPASARAGRNEALRFVGFEGGLVEIGAPASSVHRSRAAQFQPFQPFRFDNEEPRHRVFLEPFEIAQRLLTVGEWKAFADDGGYEDAALWLAEGFDWARAGKIRAPLYAHRDGGALVVFGLDGEREARDDEPITHLSFYEADAIARFFDARLPTEAEWEHVGEHVAEQVPTREAGTTASSGAFLDDRALRATPARLDGSDATETRSIAQLFGDAWEWTSSPYTPYPGFRTAEGAVGEYNGKFMVNQLVLRGGSCFTPRGHVRPSYRNFWHPETRFQMTGVRLSRDARTRLGR